MAEMPNEKENVETEEELSGRKKKKFDALLEENKKLKADIEHWKNEYYRAYADTKNLRNSLEQEHRNVMKYRAEGFIDELLPVLDSFHMALNNEVKDQALKNYLTGFQFIYRNLVTALENEGVKEIAPKIGEKFDASIMNAVDTIEDEQNENKIVKVYGKGYKLHDRLIRPAMVQVATKPKQETKTEEKTSQNKTEEKLDA